MRFVMISLLLLALCKESIAILPEKRVLYITINESGRVTVGGGDSVGVADVPKQVKDALFKSSLGNRPYSRISISKIGESISPGTLKALQDMIHEGQLAALDAICLEKHKRLFREMDPKKQAKLEKQYPVLFQTDYP